MSDTARAGGLKTVKEIAAEIGRGRTFVQAAKSEMERQGIKWTLGMFSSERFLTWVRENNFRCTDYAKRQHVLNKTEQS